MSKMSENGKHLTLGTIKLLKCRSNTSNNKPRVQMCQIAVIDLILNFKLWLDFISQQPINLHLHVC